MLFCAPEAFIKYQSDFSGTFADVWALGAPLLPLYSLALKIPPMHLHLSLPWRSLAGAARFSKLLSADESSHIFLMVAHTGCGSNLQSLYTRLAAGIQMSRKFARMSIAVPRCVPAPAPDQHPTGPFTQGFACSHVFSDVLHSSPAIQVTCCTRSRMRNCSFHKVFAPIPGSRTAIRKVPFNTFAPAQYTPQGIINDRENLMHLPPIDLFP